MVGINTNSTARLTLNEIQLLTAPQLEIWTPDNMSVDSFEYILPSIEGSFKAKAEYGDVCGIIECIASLLNFFELILQKDLCKTMLTSGCPCLFDILIQSADKFEEIEALQQKNPHLVHPLLTPPELQSKLTRLRGVKYLPLYCITN